MRIFITLPQDMTDSDFKTLIGLGNRPGWKIEFEQVAEPLNAFCERVGINVGSFKRTLDRARVHPPVELIHSAGGKRIEKIRSNPAFDQWIKDRKNTL